MKIIIFGASGMIGQALVSALKANHTVIAVGRNLQKLQTLFQNSCECLVWKDIDERGHEILVSCDLVINLVGENIGAKRWSDRQKREILESRVKATQKIAEICAQFGDRSPRLMNANAIGIYGLQYSAIKDEDSILPKTPKDFLSTVALAWEKALEPAEKAGVNIIKLRFAVVLSKNGGALKKMLPSFKFGLGSVLGSGEQPFSWVALEDVVRAILFLMEQDDVSGAFNIVADEVVSQKVFAKTLATVLKRPFFMRMPAPIVKLLFGQMGEELLLRGQRVKSKRLHALGFQFDCPSLETALADLKSP